jgi:hypothetical protein
MIPSISPSPVQFCLHTLPPMLPTTMLANTEPGPAFYIGAAILAIIAFMVGVSVKNRRWAEFKFMAEAHGFNVPNRMPTLNGTWKLFAEKTDGPRAVHMHGTWEEHASSEVGHPLHRLTIRPQTTNGLEFSFQPLGLIQSVFGIQKLRMGDPDFDDEWAVETNQPTFLLGALTPEIRELFKGLKKPMGRNGVTLKDGVITITDNAFLRPHDRFARVLRLAEALADMAEKFTPRR